MSNITIYTAKERIFRIQLNDKSLFDKSTGNEAEIKSLYFEADDTKEILRFLTESIENKHLTEIEITHFEKDIYFTSANTNDVYTLAIAVYTGNEMDSFYDSDTELTDFFKLEMVHSGNEMAEFRFRLNSLIDGE
jgi:hypothetical protein